jgi:hypothetical protein
MAKRLTKKQIREQQALEDKKFKKYLRNGALIAVLVLILVNVFFIHWCDTKHYFRKHILFGKKISSELICETENSLKHHKSKSVDVEGRIFYVCGARCKHYIVDHHEQFAFAIDPCTGESIYKADAIMGLKEKGQPIIIYFKNEETFEKYYQKKNR